MAVPELGEAVGQLAFLVGIDDGHDPHGGGPGPGEFLVAEFFPDEVTDGFGAIVIPPLAEVAVELGEQIGRKRYRCPSHAAHAGSFP
jgi:hypothetical protein